jgi:hypothetical protein
MRQMMSGLIAAVAAVSAGAAPAMACGYGSCSPCGWTRPCSQTVYVPSVMYVPTTIYVPTTAYVATTTYTGCGTTCGGWGYERLAGPTTQYYYVNQGPTYSGPGAFAPYPTYQEDAVPYDGSRYYNRHHYR